MEESRNDLAHPGAHRQQSIHPVFALGKKLDELFVQQYDRIALHNDEERNGYRREEDRLSSLMLDRSLPNEKHIEHAQAILALADKYEGSAVASLDELNDNIERHLVAFEQALESLSGQLRETTPDVAVVLQDLRRWLSLSKELLAARLAATRTIKMRLECDRYLPRIIIRNQGRPDVTLTAEESAEFQATLAQVSAMLKQSFEDNTRIEAERIPLSNQSFSDENTSDSASTPREQAQPEAAKAVKPVHPLEGKTWFRLVKVLYICLWFFVIGSCLLIGTSVGSIASALITGVVACVLLILLRKGFYYVALGRTTVAEPAGTGYLDWDELNASFEQLRATDPEMYKSAVEPFLTSWKQQYGRRVPVHAYEAFGKRVTAELEQLRSKKHQIIDDAAKKGAKIEISSLREKMEKSKAEYDGADRAAHVRAIDAWIMQLEATYGRSIPVDEASKLLDELEQKIRDEQK